MSNTPRTSIQFLYCITCLYIRISDDVFFFLGVQMCTFGGRLHSMKGRRSYVFGRKTDILRAAFLNVLEKQLNPPPPK